MKVSNTEFLGPFLQESLEEKIQRKRQMNEDSLVKNIEFAEVYEKIEDENTKKAFQELMPYLGEKQVYTSLRMSILHESVQTQIDDLGRSIEKLNIQMETILKLIGK